MSLLRIPPFGALAQGTSPYSGLGAIVTDEETSRNFARVLDEALTRMGGKNEGEVLLSED